MIKLQKRYEEISELTLKQSDAYEINLPSSLKQIVPKSHVWLKDILELFE